MSYCPSALCFSETHANKRIEAASKTLGEGVVSPQPASQAMAIAEPHSEEPIAVERLPAPEVGDATTGDTGIGDAAVAAPEPTARAARRA